MTRACLLTPEAPPELFDVLDYFTLFAQDALGDSPRGLSLGKTTMYVGSAELRRLKPVNWLATVLVRTHPTTSKSTRLIRGNAVLVGALDKRGKPTDLPDTMIDAIDAIQSITRPRSPGTRRGKQQQEREER